MQNQQDMHTPITELTDADQIARVNMLIKKIELQLHEVKDSVRKINGISIAQEHGRKDTAALAPQFRVWFEACWTAIFAVGTLDSMSPIVLSDIVKRAEAAYKENALDR